MKVWFVMANLMGNSQIFAPIFVAFQTPDPSDDRISGRLSRDVLKGLNINNIGNDIPM
ncbi:hypothetical protein D3C76_1823260 [compost metagenome]